MKRSKKEKLDTIIDESNVGIKKNANMIVEPVSIDFYVTDKKIVTNKEMFSDLTSSIHSLEVEKTLVVKYKDTYKMSFSDFKKKVTNIVFSHATKYVEKKFCTSTIDFETIIITRKENKTGC